MSVVCESETELASWRTDLGFITATFPPWFNVSPAHVKEIIERGLTGQFRKHIGMYKVDADNGGILIEDCDFNVMQQRFDGGHMEKMPRAVVERFLKLPWEDSGFSSRINSLSIGEHASIDGYFTGLDLHPRALVKWIDYLLLSTEAENYEKRMENFQQLYDIVYPQCKNFENDERFDDFKQDLRALVIHPGFYNFASQLYKSNVLDFTQMDDFLSLNNLLAASSIFRKEWVIEIGFFDMILLELCETVGVEKGFEWLKSVQDDPVPVKAWLWAMDNADTADTIPVSWWASMADD